VILIVLGILILTAGVYFYIDSVFGQKHQQRRYSIYPEKELVKSSDRIPVSLENLAGIWLKYNIEPSHKTSISVQKNTDVEAQSVTSTVSTTVSASSVTQSDKDVKVVDSIIEAFVTDTVKPYLHEITSQNAKELIEELLKFLTSYGKVPSVVLTGGDKESGDLFSVRDNLAKVTLMEHTIHVVRRMVELVNKTYQEPRNLIPEAIVVSLAHDIGKVPEFHTGQYNTYDHPLISEIKLAEIVDKLSQKPAWIDHARKVVREHHQPGVKDQLTQLLREADRGARLIELVRTTEGYKPARFSEWFDPVEFLKLVAKDINITQMDKWHAISYKGIVYARPEFLYRTADTLRHQEKVLDTLFVYGSDTQLALQEIIKALRSIDAVSPALKEGYVSQRFKVSTKATQFMGKASQQVFTPLRLDTISTITGISISEFEKRKAGLLEVLEILPD
jgi:hypothetical protein